MFGKLFPFLSVSNVLAQYSMLYPSNRPWQQAFTPQRGEWWGYPSYGLHGSYGGYASWGDGRQCNNKVRSADGYDQNCFCDKAHRHEDFCGRREYPLKGPWDGFNDPWYEIASEEECQQTKTFKTYYDDIFDEDCVDRYYQPPRATQCRRNQKSKDISHPAVNCWCDGNHDKGDDSSTIRSAAQLVSSCFASILTFEGQTLTVRDIDLIFASGHYEFEAFDDFFAGCTFGACCDELRESFRTYDPNCVHYGGYGAYGSYRGFRASPKYYREMSIYQTFGRLTGTSRWMYYHVNSAPTYGLAPTWGGVFGG